MTQRKIIAGMVAILVVGGIAGVGVYFATRPDVIETTQAEDSDSPLALVSASDVNVLNGTLFIESSFRVNNPDDISYFLTLSNLEYLDDSMEVVSLYFVVNSSEIGNKAGALTITDVANLDFPYRLPESFDPSMYRAVFFAEASGENVLGTVTFDDDEGDGDDEDKDEEGDGGSSSTTLVSTLSGSDYTVRGKITVSTRKSLVDGNVVEIQQLEFTNIETPRAPGPFLYLSKDSNKRTPSGDDFIISIPDTDEGSFTKNGNYIIDLDRNIDLREYSSGTFVVWCDPFSVYLGGGSISVQT